MFAILAVAQDDDDPLRCLRSGNVAPPSPPNGWVRVVIKVAALNRHDLWSLRRVGLPAERLPMIFGREGAGVDESGGEVIVHAVLGSEEMV